MERYLRGRSLFANVEDPLLQVRDQPFLYYEKGGLVMYSLRQHIGEERVNEALRAFLSKWRNAGPPYATSLDLYRELQAVTPDSMKSLLTDLFETITLWKTGITAATAERVGSAYQLTLDVEAKKFRSDSVGKDTEVPMNDLVDIAVFAPGNDLGKPLYLRKHRLKSGTQRITITLPERPARLAVDPYQLLIQRERERKDNVVSLTETTTDDSRKWRAEYRRR